MSHIVMETSLNGLEDALLRITNHASFRVYCVADSDIESLGLKGGRGRIFYDSEARICSLITPISTIKQNIFEAANEIERSNPLVTC